ncbi:MAG: tetratricopeptide repeat protein [Bacteroidetes bacterium]|nr:tetratricopeptide repeat protein [Bacteroidota bacterium]
MKQKVLIFFTISLLVLIFQNSCNFKNEDYKLAHDTTFHAETRAWSQKIYEEPDNDEFYAERALSFINNDKNYKLAVKDLEKAIKLNPDKNSYYIKLADAYFGNNQTYKARDMYLKAVSRNADAETYFKTGSFFFLVRKYNEAKIYLNEALKKDESYPKAYFFLAQSFKETGDTANAIMYYKRAVQTDAGDYNAYLQLGIIFTIKSDPEALKYLDAAINTNNGIDESWYSRGFYYQKKGDFEKALADYQQTITINPYHSNAYYNAGYIYFELKKWDIAIRHFDLSSRTNDDFEKPVYMLGLSYEAKNDFEKARIYYQKCLQLNPNYNLAKTAIQRLNNQ